MAKKVRKNQLREILSDARGCAGMSGTSFFFFFFLFRLLEPHFLSEKLINSSPRFPAVRLKFHVCLNYHYLGDIILASDLGLSCTFRCLLPNWYNTILGPKVPLCLLSQYGCYQYPMGNSGEIMRVIY